MKVGIYNAIDLRKDTLAKHIEQSRFTESLQEEEVTNDFGIDFQINQKLMKVNNKRKNKETSIPGETIQNQFYRINSRQIDR